MSYQPIENYGIIGNMRTVALVGINGSIDWYCYPHFDSPSIFGAILDDKKGGRFQICAEADGVRHKQFYWPSANVLVTRFLLKDGIVELEDFMPVGLPSDSPGYHHLYRRVRCVRGAVRISVACRPAFDYGRQVHETMIEANGATFKAGSLTLALSTTVPLRADRQGGVFAEFELAEGKSQVFILREDRAQSGVPCPPSEKDAEELLQGTVKFWHDWLSACTYHGRWRDQVQRSALALKLLTFEPTGAIIAAPTTSLPEVIGGARNWDYRYTWIRDAAFTVYAFLRIGFREEAAAAKGHLIGGGVTEVLDLTTPAGRAMAGLLAVFAEFEKGGLRERTRAGLEQARQTGNRLGIPMTAALHSEQVRTLYRAGLSKAEIARRLQIGRNSVRRIMP